MSHGRMPSSNSRRAPSPNMMNGYPRAGEPTLPLAVRDRTARDPRPHTPDRDSMSGTPPLRPARSVMRRPAQGHAPAASISSIQYRDSEDDEPAPQQQPRQLGNVLAAFQSVAQSKRKDEEPPARPPPRNRERDRRTNGNTRPRAATGEVDAVLDQIQDEWGFVMEDDFNPVELALQLLDDTSVGRDYNSFARTRQLLERSLKSTVDKHYQAFAASLPHHSALINSLTTSQVQIAEARTKLQEAKDAFSTKRADLVQLWSRGQTVEEMIKILDEIDRLKQIPDQLESLMAEKRLLQAAILVVRSVKAINKPEMLDIGALTDLRSYLTAQETALREILIDELNSHLYLKTFWCDGRWMAYTPNQQMLPAVPFDENDQPGGPRISRLTRYLNALALQPNENPLDLAENDKGNNSNDNNEPGSPTASTSAGQASDRNPEHDSFTYIETLLESLAVLGQLASAMDVVVQRMPVEVYSLVEGTIEDVSERAEFAKRSSTIGFGPGSATSVYSANPATVGALRMSALESPAKDADREVLRDLFWTLYSKLDAVVQGLRVIYEVSGRIGSRRDFKDSSGAKVTNLFSLVDIWTPLMGEIRTLLRDYITNDEALSSARNPIVSIQEILRDGRPARSRDKQLFRFTESDSKATAKQLRRYEDDLTRALKETVPGLVQGPADSTVQTTLMTFGSSERYNPTGNQHRLIVRPEAFHVTVLYQPSLVFMGRVTEILPPGLAETARDGSTLLDEFVLTVYFPQLEERVENLVHQAVSGADAWQTDPTTERLSPQPLLKCTTHLMSLTNSLCMMLRMTPFHRENYARLILGIVIQFYQRCSERFHDLVSPDSLTPLEEHPALAFQWAQRPEVAAILSALDGVEPNSPQMLRICRQETRIQLDFLGGRDLRKSDLIQSTRNITALGNLYHSLMWFVKQLHELKTQAEDPQSPGPTYQLEPSSAATPLESQPQAQTSAKPDDALRLPLSREMGLRFDALLKTYTQLAELILYTIRIDVRCRTVHYLGLAMKTGSYKMDLAAVEPDPYISDLNTDMTACDDAVSGSLEQKQRIFVFEGLGLLMEHMLISHARDIRFANSFGIDKIQRNILAMQQNLKTIMDGPLEAELERAKKYYSLFSLAPARLLAGIKQHADFTFDEYKTILNFQYGIDQALPESVAAQQDREYNMHLIDLHALAVDLEDDS